MKLSMNDILLINALEKVSGAGAKDCIVTGEIITYLVDEKEVGKAIGKKAVNIKELEKNLKKKVEIIGFDENTEKMVSRVFDVEVKGVKKKKNRIIVELDTISKKKVLTNMGRFKRLQELVRRNSGAEIILN